MEMAFEPGEGERRLTFPEFDGLRSNLQMRVSPLQVVGELFEKMRRIESNVASVRAHKRDNVSKHQTDAGERVIALMCVAGLAQPSKGSFVRAAISNAIQFLRPQHS